VKERIARERGPRGGWGQNILSVEKGRSVEKQRKLVFGAEGSDFRRVEGERSKRTIRERGKGRKRENRGLYDEKVSSQGMIKAQTKNGLSTVWWGDEWGEEKGQDSYEKREVR